MIFNPELFLLYRYWYFDSNITKSISKITSVDIINQWINTWFAKNDAQKKIDVDLKIYEEYLDHYQDFKTDNIYEYITLIVLYDQIPRNIYRGTSQAYKYDSIARKYIEKVIPYFESLNLIFQLTIVIGLVHSENIGDHKINILFGDKIKTNKLCDPHIWNSLNSIIKNHRDRVTYFGRIPERNKFLGRQNTYEEEVYLSSIYSN